MRSQARSLAAGLAAALLVAAFVPSCGSKPEIVPCSNAGDCETKDSRFAFCSRGRCVECVGRGSCGGNDCVDGRCVIPCKDGRDCEDPRKCVEERCVFGD